MESQTMTENRSEADDEYGSSHHRDVESGDESVDCNITFFYATFTDI
jgi:hypothetical protein